MPKFLVIETENNEIQEVTPINEHAEAVKLAATKVLGHGCEPGSDADEGEFAACMEEDGTYECDDGFRVTVWAMD